MGGINLSNGSISRFLPYETDYELLAKCRAWETRGLWGIGICSVLLPVLSYYSNISVLSIFWNIVNPLYFIIIIAYYILDVYTETFLYPATARKRRKGFIDNSLGSKFLEKSVKGYYTNDSLEIGPYKMIVNCGENCYFTMNIAKKMIPQILIKNVFCAMLFIFFAYLGVKDNLVAIPVLQILLSSLFLTELVHHINFIAKLNQLFERFKEEFSRGSNGDEVLQKAVLLFLDYETILAYNKAPLSDSVYRQLNKKLSEEWEDIKRRYDIS